MSYSRMIRMLRRTEGPFLLKFPSPFAFLPCSHFHCRFSYDSCEWPSVCQSAFPSFTCVLAAPYFTFQFHSPCSIHCIRRTSNLIPASNQRRARFLIQSCSLSKLSQLYVIRLPSTRDALRSCGLHPNNNYLRLLQPNHFTDVNNNLHLTLSIHTIQLFCLFRNQTQIHFEPLHSPSHTQPWNQTPPRHPPLHHLPTHLTSAKTANPGTHLKTITSSGFRITTSSPSKPSKPPTTPLSPLPNSPTSSRTQKPNAMPNKRALSLLKKPQNKLNIRIAKTKSSTLASRNAGAVSRRGKVRRRSGRVGGSRGLGGRR
jgi:hypothetical protein